MRLAAACGNVEDAQTVLHELKKLQSAYNLAVLEKNSWCKMVTQRCEIQQTLGVDIAADAAHKDWQATSVFVEEMRQLFGNMVFTFNEEGLCKLRAAEATQNKLHEFGASDSWTQLCNSRTLESFGYKELQPDCNNVAGELKLI